MLLFTWWHGWTAMGPRFTRVPLFFSSALMTPTISEFIFKTERWFKSLSADFMDVYLSSHLKATPVLPVSTAYDALTILKISGKSSYLAFLFKNNVKIQSYIVNKNMILICSVTELFLNT